MLKTKIQSNATSVNGQLSRRASWWPRGPTAESEQGKHKERAIKAGLIAIAISLVAITGAAPLAAADQFDNQIQALQDQNNANKQQVKQLQLQADSYQDAINKLQAQMNEVQAQIYANQARSADLKKQIAVAEVELEKQKALLGEDIKAMYLGSQISTIEMLASSNDLSEFFDKQQYREIVQTKIKGALDKVTALKVQLRTQDEQVQQLLKDEQTMNDQLAADRDKQNQLLGYTQAQKDQYTAAIKAANSQITSLREQQAAAERAAFGGSSSTGGVITYSGLTGQQLCGGGYNFHCADTQDAYTDYWGLWNRECVSYAAWYEATVKGKAIPYYFFAGVGNANQWQGDLIRNPSVGSVIYPNQLGGNYSAIVGTIVYMPIGVLGHVGAVLRDEGGGWVRVGQYNIYDMGMYSEMDLKITNNLIFFRFN